MLQTTIKDLPAEILTQILFHVSQNESLESPKANVKNIRLVSRRFEQIASDFLIPAQITVRLSTTSLSRLEGISSSHNLRNSVTRVTIDLSYYDVNLARDVNLFGQDFASHLARILDNAARLAKAKSIPIRNHLLNASLQFGSLEQFQHDESGATTYHKNLINLHRVYVSLTNDQESLRVNNRHVYRLVAAPKNFPAVDSICLSDDLKSKYAETWRVIEARQLEHPDLFLDALKPCSWDTTLRDPSRMVPPAEMLAELLSQLGNCGLTPRSVLLSISTHGDLRILRPTADQSVNIRRFVSRCSDVQLSSRDWTCKDWSRGKLSQAGSRDQMLSLGSLSTALTSTSTIQHLSLSFYKYHDLHQFRSVNLSDLPSFRSIPWPDLSSIIFRVVPVNQDDLVALVDASQYTMKSFHGETLYLRNGDWGKVLDTFRSWKTLEEFSMWDPRYGLRGHSIPCPRETRTKAKAYVLGEINFNPF